MFISSKMRTAACRMRECNATCVRAHLHYLFSCFWQHFCIIVSCFICRNVTLFFFQKRCVHQKRLFFSNEINFCRLEISFFYLRVFCGAKLAKTLLILIKQNLRYTLYFRMISYFEKSLCRVFYLTNYLQSLFDTIVIVIAFAIS